MTEESPPTTPRRPPPGPRRRGWRRLVEPRAPDHLRGELDIEITVRITRLQGMVGAGYLVTAAAAAWYAHRSGAPLGAVVATIAPVVLVALLSLGYGARYRRAPRPRRVSPRAIGRIFAGVALAGLVWGLALAGLGSLTDATGQAMMLLIATGVAGAGVTFLYFLPSAAIAFAPLSTTPPALALALDGTTEALTVLPLYLAWVGFAVGASLSSHASFVENLSMRVENEGLRVRAESANAARSAFLTAISHDLRTPLNAICGFAQLLALEEGEAVERDKVHQSSQRILTAADYLLRMVTAILDTVELDSGVIHLAMESIEPPRLFGPLLASIAPAATEGRLRLSRGEQDAGSIRVDRHRLEQIIENYLSNAVKYNRPGGTVELSCVRRPDSWLRVQVRDTGIGVPADEQHKLFTRFGRADSTTALVEGAGIGLYANQRAATLMGGRTGFASEEGVGSTFWVEFPLEDPDRAEAPGPRRGPGGA